MHGVRFSPRQLLFIALNTLRAAVHQKVLTFLLLLALALVLGAQSFREFHFGSPELKFISELGFGAMALFGAVLAVVATAQLFFNEIEHRTVLTLLAKPVGRAEFLLGKFLGVAVVIGAFCGLLTVVLAGVLWMRETALRGELPEALAGGRAVNYAHLAAIGLLQWLKLAVLAALTLLVASYAQTQLFTMVTGFLVCVICHLQYLAQEAAARAGAPASRVIANLVALIFPNFQLFTDSGLVTWSQLAWVSAYAFAYMAAACALAVYYFSRREL